MSNFVLFDLSAFSVLVLIALLVVIYFKHEIPSHKSTIFKLIIVSTILMNVLEVFSWAFNGIDTYTSFILNHIFNFFFIALNTLVVSLWASYIDFLVYEDKKRLKRRTYYMHPTILVIVLTTINLFYPIMYEISEVNVYSRLSFLWVSMAMTLIVYFVILIIVLRNKKSLNNTTILGVMLFLVLPLVAAVLQLRFYGLFLIWPSTAVAVLFSYLIFETTSGNRDFLTGLFTRVSAERRISKHLQKRRKFSVIMIDLDDFKMLNDTFGHRTGDRILISMARILKKVFNSKAVVSRFGGDEFIIVVEGVLEGEINYQRKEIERLIKKSTDIELKETKFSFGVSYCQNPSSSSIEEMIVSADNNMYFDKAKNKNNKRRKSDR